MTHDEIDFIATKYEEKLYIQVCFTLENEETKKREFASLYQIKDNYPKYIISKDKDDYSKDGIIYKNIIDFLLEK